MADEDLTFNEVKKLKVAELKARLSKLGLHVLGLKADLVARLSSYCVSKVPQAAETVEGEEDVKGTNADNLTC